jgi:hypothetical protein
MITKHDGEEAPDKATGYSVGDLVIVRAEWCDSAAERERVYVVTAGDEGKGRIDIAPRDWDEGRDGRFRPTQTVRVNMVERVPVFPTAEAIATRFLAQLTPADVAYATDSARGQYRGFAALHDRFDANEMLWDATGIAEPYDVELHTDLLNRAMEEINRRMLS